MNVNLESKAQEILNLLKEKKMPQLKELLVELKPVDIADIVDELAEAEAIVVFRLLPKELAVEVFSCFEIDKQKKIAELITAKELNELVSDLYFDDMIDLLEEMPAEIVSDVLQNTAPEQRKLINQFLAYPPHSAGALMTIEFVELSPEWTVREGIEHVREVGLTKETIYTCYVINKTKKLLGILSLRELVTANLDLKIEDIMDEDVITVNTHDDQEDVADTLKRYGFLALPVVDNNYRLTGIITFDDIIDVIEDEATEDFQKMAAMTPSDEAYLDLSVFALAKHRVMWLLILMISATFTGAIIEGYQETLDRLTILSAFIPMLMDTGGNAGSQSSTLIIRGLATGDIETKDFLKVLWKEIRVAVICGVILSAVNFARLVFINNLATPIAFAVSATLVCTVLMAKIVGSMLPIIAEKLKLDPAIMAGPLITTIVDAGALMIYFRLATSILHLI